MMSSRRDMATERGNKVVWTNVEKIFGQTSAGETKVGKYFTNRGGGTKVDRALSVRLGKVRLGFFDLSRPLSAAVFYKGASQNFRKVTLLKIIS